MFVAVLGGIGAGLYAGSNNANPAVASLVTGGAVTATQAMAVSAANARVESDILSDESSGSFLTDAPIAPGKTLSGIVIIQSTSQRTAELAIGVDDQIHNFGLVAQ